NDEPTHDTAPRNCAGMPEEPPDADRAGQAALAAAPAVRPPPASAPMRATLTPTTKNRAHSSRIQDHRLPASRPAATDPQLGDATHQSAVDSQPGGTARGAVRSAFARPQPGCQPQGARKPSPRLTLRKPECGPRKSF